MCRGRGLNGLAMRNNVTRMATLKSDQKAAPAFAWYFTWQSPMLEDAGAWHTAELAFCFDNTLRCAARCQTMVFDDACRMVDDPDGEARKILLS
jgi:para-nitrobenzyl esterase